MLLLTVNINLFQSKKPLDFPGRTLQQKRAGDERVQRVDMRKERVAVSMLCVSIRTNVQSASEPKSLLPRLKMRFLSSFHDGHLIVQAGTQHHQCSTIRLVPSGPSTLRLLMTSAGCSGDFPCNSSSTSGDLPGKVSSFEQKRYSTSIQRSSSFISR